jgi:hypothetical protein
MPRNLIIAYAITWVIHGLYLLWLWKKWKRG